MTPSLTDKLKSLQRLPSPSSTALRLLELANSEDVSMHDVAAALESDPALCTRVLKYANSPIIGARTAVTTVRQAVMLLGIRAVKVTALSFSLVTSRTIARCPSFDFNLFWAYAAATAVAARGTLQDAPTAARDEAFVAGLISQIGKLAFAMTIPDEYERMLKSGGGVLRVGVDAERKILGVDHVDIGARLLTQWKLPALLVGAVRRQLDPKQANDPAVHRLAAGVQTGQAVANELCGIAERGSSPITAALADAEFGKLLSEFRELAGVLSISLADLPDPVELVERAAEMLADMSVAAHVEHFAIVHEKRALEARALEDGLTGIANRAAFEQQFATEIALAARDRAPLTLLLIDIDRFKQVNDRHGHLAGDAVLRSVATIIRGVVRQSDFVARYGGEEFAVIAPRTDAQAAANLAERIRKAVESARHVVPNGVLSVTVSSGAAAAAADARIAPNSLVECADRELYRAKAAGRNRAFVAAYKDAEPKAPTTPG